MILKIRIAYIFLKLRKKSVLEPILLAISLCFSKETILMLSFSQQKVTYLMTFSDLVCVGPISQGVFATQSENIVIVTLGGLCKAFEPSY